VFLSLQDHGSICLNQEESPFTVILTGDLSV
jgi:hypothetical protein